MHANLNLISPHPAASAYYLPSPKAHLAGTALNAKQQHHLAEKLWPAVLNALHLLANMKKAALAVYPTVDTNQAEIWRFGCLVYKTEQTLQLQATKMPATMKNH